MIPKVIHHIWVGPPMPDALLPYVQSWRALHPDWEHVMWHDFDWLDNQDLYDDAEEITPHVGQLRADLARYEILWRHGGVYVDCDMEALQPIDDLLGVDCFAGWETNDVWVNNAVIGAAPGHPLFRDLIEAAPASIRAHKGMRPNRMTGPHLFTPHAVRHDITIHPSTAFYPYAWTELDRAGEDFPGSWAVHHWWNQRKIQNRPLPETARA